MGQVFRRGERAGLPFRRILGKRSAPTAIFIPASRALRKTAHLTAGRYAQRQVQRLRADGRVMTRGEYRQQAGCRMGILPRGHVLMAVRASGSRKSGDEEMRALNNS